jgi:hypothetical protein
MSIDKIELFCDNATYAPDGTYIHCVLEADHEGDCNGWYYGSKALFNKKYRTDADRYYGGPTEGEVIKQ